MMMKLPIPLLTLLTTLGIHPALAVGQDHHRADLKEQGQMAMGFDQDKATHHFTLTGTGGTIAVTANDPADAQTRDRIQAHLKEIAVAFANGDFEKPLKTHGEMPPGASDMQRYQADIKYTSEVADAGGLVRIETSSKKALKAVHAFLRYQIREHRTGDPLTIQHVNRPR